MITRDQAFSAEEFHEERDGLPCTVWHRGGSTYPTFDNGFFVPVFSNTDPADMRRRETNNPDDPARTRWHHITGVNAAGVHVPEDCPRRQHEDNPPGSGRTRDQLVPTGQNEYDANGYDVFGFDRDGYDADGYDRNGYDADGYDRDGYDADDQDRDGRNRYGVDASDLDLAALWDEFTSGRTWLWDAFTGGRTWDVRYQHRFREHLRTLARDPGDIDELGFCGNCLGPAWSDDLSQAGTGASICDSCWDDWCNCGSCDERYPSDDLYEMLSGSEVCVSCRSSYYTYCDHCGGYYDDNDAGYHDHGSDDGCCESPQPAFTIRNDGQEPLKNDTRITVTLPAGEISDEGLDAIILLLRRHGHYDVSYNVSKLGTQWQAREGNFTKRLSRMAYNDHQAKLMPDVLSEVGNIARAHSTAVDVVVEFSRDLNADAADWYHGDSCWWGSYSDSRCAFKTNGGVGMRTWVSTDDTRSYPQGRAWLMPLRLDEHQHLVPTFNVAGADAYVVFNGYGDLSGYAPARIVAHMTGWTYRKIDFSASPMYINAGGYLIGPEHIAKPYTDGYLNLSVSQHSSLYSREQNNA